MHPDIKTNFPLDQHKRRGLAKLDQYGQEYKRWKSGPPAYHEPEGGGYAQKAARVGSRDLLIAIARCHAKNAKDIPTRRSWEMVAARA